MPLYAEVSQMEILTAFEDFIKELEREDLSIKKQERRRTERKNRERYVELLKGLFEARLVNQRTRWRDLVKGFDPATVPGIPADLISKMETEESKATTDSSHNLVKVVRDGLVKHVSYLDLIS